MVNNLEWYTKVKQFCRLSDDCDQCPYHCLAERGEKMAEPGHCFENREKLEALESWLSEPHGGNVAGEPDQWLQELLNQQFAESAAGEEPLWDD